MVFVVWSYIYFYAFRTLPGKLVVIKIYVVAYNSNDRKDFSMLMVACAVVDQLSTLVDKGGLVYG